MVTREAVKEFLLSRGGLRPRTVAEYGNHLKHFERCFPNLPTTPQPIQGYLNSFTGLTPETVHSRFRTLRAFFKQIHLWHPDVPNPMPLVRPPRLLPKAMRIFSDEELFSLFRLPLSPRENALLTLLIDIGPRSGECAALTWDDVAPGYIILRGKTGERIVPISDTTYRLLSTLRNGASSSKHVFLGKRGALTQEGIYKLVRHLCREAGISGRRCSPHTFRHTFGTDYAAADGSDPKVLQDILGHKDFKTTLRYIQNNPRRMARNHQRCTPLKLVGAAAQQRLFDADKARALEEAEEILARKGGG